MENEAWEALDVDDSDLHSLLRPCKRNKLHLNPNLSIPSSQTSQQLSQNSHPQLHSPPQHRLIPGPAGAVQAAMLRRTHDRQIRSLTSSQGDDVIPTQEYIRRAVEDSSDFDEDFQSNPWLCALEFVGAENGKIPCTPLSSVNKCLKSSRVDKVVSVVKSCTQSGLGGLMVTLKDPTGSIGASIHHKVLSESQYGKDICIGSVLILQKVAVFCPSSSAYYLNITLGNLTKLNQKLCLRDEKAVSTGNFLHAVIKLIYKHPVFCKESRPPSVNSLAAYEVNFGDPEIASAPSGKASALHKISLPDKETTKDIMDDRTTECMSAGGSLHNENQMDKENLVPNSYIYNNSPGYKKTSLLGRECLDQITNAAKEFEGTVRNRGILDENSYQQMGEKFQGSLSPKNQGASSTKSRSDPEIQITDEARDHGQPTSAKLSLPQWTDEQLYELFACDDDVGSPIP